jgi:hypothetical protein
MQRNANDYHQKEKSILTKVHPKAIVNHFSSSLSFAFLPEKSNYLQNSLLLKTRVLEDVIEASEMTGLHFTFLRQCRIKNHHKKFHIARHFSE